MSAAAGPAGSCSPAAPPRAGGRRRAGLQLPQCTALSPPPSVSRAPPPSWGSCVTAPRPSRPPPAPHGPPRPLAAPLRPRGGGAARPLLTDSGAIRVHFRAARTHGAARPGPAPSAPLSQSHGTSADAPRPRPPPAPIGWRRPRRPRVVPCDWVALLSLSLRRLRPAPAVLLGCSVG